MSDCRKCAEFDWCVENEDCGLFKPKPQTNADRIRAMTDEELAEFMNHYDCPPTRQGSICLRPSERCDNCWLSWLKQEVKV